MIAAALGLLIALGAAAAPPDPAEAFLARVKLEPGLSPSESAELRRALRRIVSTPTGREYADRFVAEGWTVRLGTAAMGVRMSVNRGRSGPEGMAGGLFTELSPPLAVVDSVLVSSSPDTLIRIVAHEVLGHAVSHLEAKKAGVESAWGLSAEDEMLAEAVGDLVRRESGVASDPSYWGEPELIRSTEAYVRLQWFGLTGHPANFSIEEASAPAEAMMNRGREYIDEMARLTRSYDGSRVWRQRMQHFIRVHGESLAAYAAQFRYLDEADESTNAHIGALNDAQDAAYERRRMLATADGIVLRRRLSSPRYLEFARAKVVEIGRLRSRLIAMGERKIAPVEKGNEPPGQDAWDALLEKCEADKKKNPDHWR